MGNASLKDQLEAVASQLSTVVKKPSGKVSTPKKKFTQAKQHASKAPAKNNKPKPAWLEYAQYGVALLRVYFPNCFTASGEARPLKKGIKQDLVKHLSILDSITTDDKACMVKSLSYYVNMHSYLKAVVEGASRVDLDGNPAEVVTAEEAKYSEERQQARIDAKKSGGKPQAVVERKEVVEQHK